MTLAAGSSRNHFQVRRCSRSRNDDGIEEISIPKRKYSKRNTYVSLKNGPRNFSQAPTSFASDDDVIIAVMGVTGSGKSTFISLLAQEEVKVGHSLESRTTQVESFQLLERWTCWLSYRYTRLRRHNSLGYGHIKGDRGCPE